VSITPLRSFVRGKVVEVLDFGNVKITGPAKQGLGKVDVSSLRSKDQADVNFKPAAELYSQAKVVEAFSVENIERAIENANGALKGANNSLRFQVDQSINRPIVSVVDQDSGKVIRQFPSEEMVRVTQNIDSLRGIIFDKRT
tara:strand:- start:1603 stop:2028 length:426 start_codon:yes stop_codon:yes gene_type:complete